jgi:hypothetical protein
MKVHKVYLFFVSKGGVLFFLTGTCEGKGKGTGTVVTVLVAEPCRLFMYEWSFNDDRTIKESI